MANGYGGNGGGYGGGSSSYGTVTNGAVSKSKPTQEISKSVSYVASGTDSNQILSISATDSSSAAKTDLPKAIEVENTGAVPAIVIAKYESYSDEDTDAGVSAVHTMIMPGETFHPPVRGIIPTANHLQALDGVVVDFTITLGDGSNTTADFESDSGDNIASGELNNTTDPVVFELDNGHEKYRVGDFLRVENEIIRVEGTYDDNPTTSTVADNHIVVSRGHLGSTTASHSGTPDVMFPCTNELYDFDRALQGSSQLVSTDSLGRFKLSNFFGYARKDATADNETFGLVPGSIAFRFWSQAYQEVMMGGTGADGGSGVSNIMVTTATSTKLSTSTAYAFDLTIDDSAATTVSFTTDSSNVNFGGTNGVITKIQDAINSATRTAGNALFGYGCTVSIINGALRFTSNSHLSPHDGTNGSKILLADASSGTNLFAGSSGIFPDVAMVNAPVKPIIDPVSIYNPITYGKSPNIGAMLYDNGLGDLIYGGKRVGKINYETGAFEFQVSSLPNAEFEFQLAYDTPFAGKLDADTEDTGMITALHANVINKNMKAELNVKVY